MNRLSQATTERVAQLLAELDARSGFTRKRPAPRPIADLAREYVSTPCALSPAALATLGIRKDEDRAA